VLEKGPLTEFRVQEPIGVKVAYYRAGTELFFEGGLHASTTAVCARCAEEFAAHLCRIACFTAPSTTTSRSTWLAVRQTGPLTKVDDVDAPQTRKRFQSAALHSQGKIQHGARIQLRVSAQVNFADARAP
jgi:hypothetical protein